jgi:electron transport complex protein RnfA
MIFSGLAVNLMLQCGLGIRGAAEVKSTDRKIELTKLGIIFTVTILLWTFFVGIVSSIISGVFIYVLLFPVSSLAYDGLEFLIFRYLLEEDTVGECPVSFPGGITAAALFICLNIANNFIEAVVLSFGFVTGIFLVLLVLGEIRRRAYLEAVPRFLRGKPLALVSMGLLSLVFSTASLLLFRMIGG